MSKSRKEIVIAGVAATRKRPVSHCALASVLLALALIVPAEAGNRSSEDCDIWFVHATDPHIFLKPTTVAREEQQKQNRAALTDMLQRIRSLPHGDGPPAFLVLTGDLGIDPCDIRQAGNPPSTSTPPAKAQTQPPAETNNTANQDKQDAPSVEDCLKVVQADRENQIKQTAELLVQSPVQDIYLVAGNNDIANESAGDAALKYFNDFIDAVQAKLAEGKSGVRLHNLTRCYASGEAPATCYTDIANTAYRLIGFPSYSFKNTETQAQAKQIETFRRLLEESRQAGKRVLIISHTPEMDDPYLLAESRYIKEREKKEKTETKKETAPKKEEVAKTDTETKKSPSVSTWNASKNLLDDWKDVLAPESVVAVFAGHLHDSHKEIYERPYTWSNGSEHRPAFQKLFLAPPLAVKNQDNSLIQARGFSLVRLQSDCVASQLFWYNSETQEFSPDPKPKHHGQQHGFWQGFCDRSQATVTWLWELGDAQNSKSLDRMAMLLIAILATFLTVVALWQIPASDNPLTGEPGQTKPAVDPSPFSGRFGATVIAGLGGLAATTVLKSFEGKPSAGDKEFYIVWFIISFFILLVLSAFLRGLVEALRARFAIIYYPLPRPTESSTSPKPQEGQPPPKEFPLWPSKLWRWLWYRFHAGLHWLSSLRVPLLTFADTFTNLIQGKNYTITQAFSDKIVDQQRSVLRVANTIRKQLYEVIMQGLRKPLDDGAELETEVRPDDVRVNISVLSLDQNSVFYISRAAGSSRQAFLKHSVAWVSVFTGKIRWYKHTYSAENLFKEIILFNNSDKTIADDQPEIHLNSHYQPRAGEDYKAFVVFPVPWPQRGLGTEYVKGAIQISFRREEDFDRLWSFVCTSEDAKRKVTKEIDDKIQAAKEAERQQLQRDRLADIDTAVKATRLTCDPVIDHHGYESEDRMLQDWCRDPELCATLNTAVKVLGEVLRGFNEHIYKSIGKSEQAD